MFRFEDLKLLQPELGSSKRDVFLRSVWNSFFFLMSFYLKPAGNSICAYVFFSAKNSNNFTGSRFRKSFFGKTWYFRVRVCLCVCRKCFSDTSLHVSRILRAGSTWTFWVCCYDLSVYCTWYMNARKLHDRYNWSWSQDDIFLVKCQFSCTEFICLVILNIQLHLNHKFRKSEVVIILTITPYLFRTL